LSRPEAYPSIYAALAAGDPAALTSFGLDRTAPHIVALAAAARRERLAPKVAAQKPSTCITSSTIRNTSMTYPARDAAPPQPSRGARSAEVFLGPINMSRMRAGLEPLAAADLAHEFSDIDRLPPERAKLSRHDAGNLAAQRMGAPTSAQDIDAMWGGIVARLNATLPASRGPDAGRRAAGDDGRREQGAAVDWGSITAKLNAENGLTPPARGRAR
jgi:hypothetical protein